MVSTLNVSPSSVILLTALIGLTSRAPAAEDNRPPNVVLIIADDMGWTDYGFMGHPRIHTPRLDRLASQSLVFRRGYATSSLCSPSLASILTGRYPHQHKITSNDPPLPPGVDERAAPRDPEFLARRRAMIQVFDDLSALPRLLASKDYLSFQSGKWWGGSYQRGGFTHGMTHGEPDRGGRHGDAGLAIGRRGMKPVFLFIELAQVRKAPFFLWYAPMMPHQPHNPPERLLAHYRQTAPSLAVAKYWAMCEWFDETCGELLDFLDAQKLAQDTLVIFLADNGWIQDPQAERYAPRSKQSPAGLEGINLLDAKAVAGRPAIFGAVFTHNAVDIHDPVSSLRSRWIVAGDWKLIVPDRRNTPDGLVELFDVGHDPGETRNLAGEQAPRVADLMVRLDAWWAAGPR
jgi:arylsulfatase A-like enzyme